MTRQLCLLVFDLSVTIIIYDFRKNSQLFLQKKIIVIWTLNIKDTMKEFKLQDFYTEEQIKTIKDKLEQLPREEQFLLIDILSRQIDQTILERFPEKPLDVTRSTRILRKEFAFVYQK